jgi:hypothetical protein
MLSQTAGACAMTVLIFLSGAVVGALLGGILMATVQLARRADDEMALANRAAELERLYGNPSESPINDNPGYRKGNRE